jgi:hypothetical protein
MNVRRKPRQEIAAFRGIFEGKGTDHTLALEFFAYLYQGVLTGTSEVSVVAVEVGSSGEGLGLKWHWRKGREIARQSARGQPIRRLGDASPRTWSPRAEADPAVRETQVSRIEPRGDGGQEECVVVNEPRAVTVSYRLPREVLSGRAVIGEQPTRIMKLDYPSGQESAETLHLC